MKQTVFLFLISIIPCFSIGQIIDIPDTNFKKTLLLSSNRHIIAYNVNYRKTKIDINEDGEIQVSEAEKIIKLNLGNREIKSLEGLKYFKNLREIFCQNNQIDSIDIRHLPNLIMLHCHHNNLTVLKIGKKNNLERLYCSFNNFTTLNLEKATNLTALSCNLNKIKELSLNGCVNLLTLACGSNQIAEIDLTSNIALVYLSAGGNKLTTIDLGTNQFLKNIYLHQNNLHFINFKNNLKSNVRELYINKNASNLIVCIDNSDSFYKVIEDFTTPISSNCEEFKVASNLDVEEIIKEEESLNKKNKINIYPNPASEYFNLSETVSELLIYDNSGKQCLRRSINVNKVDVSNLSDGIYFIIYVNREGERSIKKLIKI